MGTLVSAGSWATYYADSPEEYETALALPGSWPGLGSYGSRDVNAPGAQLEVLVRSDQWSALVPPPVITGVFPGAVASGTPRLRSVAGTGFTATSQVLYDSTPAPESTYVNPGEMTYRDPAAVVGTHQITVRNGTVESNAYEVSVI
jgi:IPT/TIG domain